MPIQKITKEEIIQKSFGVFLAKGYHDTSISDLAEACGIHNAHFYYYFKNKEDLMAAVLESTKRKTEEKLQRLVEDTQLSAKQKMEQVTLYYEKFYSKYEGGCIMGNTTLGTVFLEAKFAPIIKSFFESWIEATKKIFLAKYQEEKALELAEATVQDIEGGIMFMKLYKDKKYLMNALKRAERQLD